MTKKKLSFKKWLSMLLTAVMLVAALPISAFAAPASGIPANMLDNVYLDALAYTGYNVQAQKDDSTIFIKTGSSVSASIRSGIGYGTGPSGLETNSGGTPDIARFRSNGLCCASYVSYVYYNYMPNVAHINTATVPCPSNPRSATAYNTAANSWVESGKARRISFTQSSDGNNFNPSEEIPIGSLIVFKHIPTGSVAHVAIYAGYYNGKHFVTHVGNDRGPEFSTIVGMSKGDYPEAVVQVVVPGFVEAYGSIEVQKNDTNGKGLAGAYFVATSQKDGTQYLIGPTDDSGHGSSIERIPYGQYTVKETEFPANYRAYGQTEWTVTVSAANNGVVRFTAVNEEIPGNVKIVKESEDGKISGIRLNISGNGVNEDVVTGPDGSIIVKNLKPGTYTVSEYEYEGYVPQPPQTVTVVSGGTSIVTFSNLLQRGNLVVTKTSEDGLIEGHEFRLYGTSTTGQQVDMYAVSDSSGKATFKEVPVGTYTLSEENTAVRYVIPEDQTVTVTWKETAEAAVDNTLKKWRADIYKLDAEHADRNDQSSMPQLMAADGYEYKSAEDLGYPYGYTRGDATLEGAVYGVYLNGELVKTYTTDKDGYILTDYFPCGDGWTIREITPSEGYLLDDMIYPVGAYPEKYSVEYNTLTMDVYETPIKSNIVLVKHSDNGDTQIETPEAGAQFKIWLKSSGSYEAADETERDLITIDEHGFGVSKDLPYGTYIVEQISGKEGAELLPAFEVYIKTHADIYSYIINNAPITALIDVVKKDATTGKVIPAAGIGFKIRDLQSGEFITQRINYPTPVDIDVFYTDNTGRLRLPEPLGYGEYELIEQTVGGAEGYVLDSTPVKFKVDGSAEVVVVEKYNQPQMGTITILKRGEVFATVTEQDGIYTPHYEVQGLAGAVFGVYAVEDTYTLDGTKRYSAGDKVATLTTAADGTAISEPLFLGKFELREEKAPYGMVLLKEPVQTELTYAGEQVKITTVSETAVNERQKVVISLLKKLESDNTYGVGLGEEYKNIRFGLYAAEPLTAADGTEIPQDGLLEIVGIDENGLAVFTADVPAGAKLYVKEVATDAHYLLSDAIYPVAFDYEDVSVAFVQLVINNGEVIENTIIRGSIHGLKVDEDNTPVAGAVFGLFKANETEFTEENALATATPGEDGVFTFENIPYGDWIVRELSCPAHLVLSEESYKVTVSEKDQIIEITVVNKFLTGKVQVRKVSSKDHDKLLSGAEFVLYLDVNGNKAYDPDIDTLYGELSEADTGVYELSGLKHGGYLLLETKAPDGFTKDDRYFYFPIQKDGETVIVENEIGVGFTNEPIPTPTPKYPDSPQTGDNSKLWLWILLASGSLTVLITVSIVSRKKRKAL